MIERLARNSLVRFGIVAGGGLVIDISVAWSLAKFAGLPLALAAACGIVAGAAVNYVIHERWTFGAGTVSARRGSLYAAMLATTLVVRVAIVTLLQKAFPQLAQMAVLVLAVGVSFAVNYLLSRYLIFRPDTRAETHPE